MSSAPLAFPSETLTFLRHLKANNRRDWFQANKSTYETAVKAPLLAFASELSEQIATVAPAYASPPGKAVQRIYRDIRFSPNKTPYRTELGMLFVHRDLGKKAGAGLYVAILPDSVTIAGGLYQQDPAGLYLTRQHLVENLTVFQKLISTKALTKAFGELSGESLKRPPRGLDPLHPAMDLLKRTQWLLEANLPVEAAIEPGFLHLVFSHLKLLLPFVQFFEKPLLQKNKPAILE